MTIPEINFPASMFDSLLINESWISSLTQGIQRQRNNDEKNKEIEELWDHLEDFEKEKHDKFLNSNYTDVTIKD